MTRSTLVEQANRLIEFFRPTRSFGAQEVFQFRFLVGGGLLGLAVAILSATVEIIMGHWLNAAVISLFGAGLVGMLVSVRAGASIPAMSWFCLLLLGWFLAAVSLLTAEFHESQLRWLVLLPMVSLALAGAHPAPDRPAPLARVVGVAALLAILLGVSIVMAHRLGWTAGQPEPPSTAIGSTVALLIDYVLFVISVTGLLWIYHAALRRSEEELQLLRQMLSVCAWCKRIHDAEDGWIPMERHLEKHQATSLSHGICPDCAQAEFHERGQSH